MDNSSDSDHDAYLEKMKKEGRQRAEDIDDDEDDSDDEDGMYYYVNFSV